MTRLDERAAIANLAPMAEPQIQVQNTPHDVAVEAANRIVAAYEEAIELKGRFSIALSGGSTPKALYELLAQEPYRSQLDWAKVHVLFADERCVPPDHADSNYNMARATLLSKVPIPPDNIYRMRGEIDPQEAAKEYGLMLKEQFDDGGCDLVLLGMGEDGHTASLFPGTQALKEADHRCVANFVPKLNAWRLTMTAPFINRAWQVMVLVTGAGKAERVRQVLEDQPDPNETPIRLIDPDVGRLVLLMDAAAAGMTAD